MYWDFIFLFIFGFIFGYLINTFLSWLTGKIPVGKNKQSKEIIRKVRIHVDVTGYILIMLGFFIYMALLFGIGLGIVIGHKFRDGLLNFVEEEELLVRKKVKRDKENTERKIEKERKRKREKVDKIVEPKMKK